MPSKPHSTQSLRMVDISGKLLTRREAVAEALVHLKPATIEQITAGRLPKGNVLAAAELAGIQAAKKTWEWLPMCHPLNIAWVNVTLEPGPDRIRITATVKTREATGVEMEALTDVSAAALCIYDMCKAVDKEISITDIRLIAKRGGRSDHQEEYRPRVGILVLSDSVSQGKSQDKSGAFLKKTFSEAGCEVTRFQVIPDDQARLKEVLEEWLNSGVELLITTGSTGPGPRDIAPQTVLDWIEERYSGIEAALHSRGRESAPRAMLSRLVAGRKGNSLVVCLPGSLGAVKDATEVLIPHVFHFFPMRQGAGHP